MNKSKKLSGKNIYTNKKNQTIYYDKITKKGYLIPQQKENTYYIFQHRFILVFLFTIICSEYLKTWQQSVFVGAGLCIIAETIFRATFLASLRKVTTVDTSNRKSLLETIIFQNNIKKAILKCVLYFAFAILIILNAYQQKATIPVYTLSYFISLYSAYYAVIHSIGIQKMVKRNKQK